MIAKADSQFLPRKDFQRLLDELATAGYRCFGPRAENGVIEFSEVATVADFTSGLVDKQAPGSYRLVNEGGSRYFAWANGAQALKPLTFQPVEILWEAQRLGKKLRFVEQIPSPQPLAVIGVRACDLAALALQEQHFKVNNGPDPAFSARRDALLLVGVDCVCPAATCFCGDTGDGPNLQSGYDIGLSELDDGFVVTTASVRGAAVVAALKLAPAAQTQLSQAQGQRAAAAENCSRGFPGEQALRRLSDLPGHPRWEAVAARCLGCGNCTSVCPTCFCSSNQTRSDLRGEVVRQMRVWDSCFSPDHSVLHGKPVRGQLGQRYRQWLTHKLASWQEQYGRSGCVGCGRCITWCPVGIDIGVETLALLGQDEPP